MSLGRTLFGAIALAAFLACSPVLGPEVNPVEQSENVVGVASLVGPNAEATGAQLTRQIPWLRVFVEGVVIVALVLH